MPRTIDPARQEPRSVTRAAGEPPGAYAFPGCRPFRLSRDAVDTYDGRFEFWDAETETAWAVAEPTGGAHERPSRRLAALCEVIASLRGGPIECRGSVDLVWNAAERTRRRILQADEVVWIYPARARIPEGGLMLGTHDLPDVVLEVDHTTDVRRGKLDLYAAWGFPEVWVEVPDVTTPSRPAGRTPGLTVYRRAAAGRYRAAASSDALPGWSADAIHVALNEPVRSPATDRALAGVARVLGARDGTGPDDTPWLHQQRAASRREGRNEARRQERAAALRLILAGRGMGHLEPVLAESDAAALPLAVALEAVQRCRDAADLRERLARADRGAEPLDR
ncbi:MAG: Uma2 family endonuclease [Acidobacteria bacterium]|nr:Uma2 family endonuclease [Acidobacteriota bacterium]